MSNKKYTHMWTAKDLDNTDHELVTNYQDIVFWLDFVAFPKKWRNDITAIIVIVSDGDLDSMWLSESGRYYMLDADYQPLPYYRPNWWTKKNLPIYWLESNTDYHK